MHLRLAPVGLLLACLTAFGCSDDDDAVSQGDIDRYCDAICTKQSDCSNGVVNADTCSASCRQTSSDPNDGTCEVTRGEADACISAIESTSCSDLQAGNIPAACSICEPGEDDAGIAGDSGVSLAMSCSDLSACCDTLSGVQKTSCESTVNLNQGAACTGLLSSLQMSGQCGGGGTSDAGTTGDTGASMDAGESTDTGGMMSGMSCDDLAACCAMLPAAAQGPCNTVASAGNEMVCANTLQGLRDQMLCQ